MKPFNDVINKATILKANFDIKKADEDKRLTFGWESVANRNNGGKR